MVFVVAHHIPHFAYEHLGGFSPICKAKCNGFSASRPTAPPTHGHVSAAVLPPMDVDSWYEVDPIVRGYMCGWFVIGCNWCMILFVRYAGIRLGLVMSAISSEFAGVVLKPVEKDHFEWPCTTKLRKPKGVTVRWFKTFQGMFDYQLQPASHIVRMPRSR